MIFTVYTDKTKIHIHLPRWRCYYRVATQGYPFLFIIFFFFWSCYFSWTQCDDDILYLYFIFLRVRIIYIYIYIYQGIKVYRYTYNMRRYYWNHHTKSGFRRLVFFFLSVIYLYYNGFCVYEYYTDAIRGRSMINVVV